jgi:hypothetical protein
VDIRKCTKLIPFLKKKSVGFRSKKSKIFTRQEFDKLFVEAPDNKYLMMKVTHTK